MEILGEEDSVLRSSVVGFLSYSFESSEKVSQTFMQKEKRFSYVTPKSFFELLKLYVVMLGSKVAALDDKKGRLTNGLEKLRVIQEQVAEHEKKHAGLTVESDKVMKGKEAIAADVKEGSDKLEMAKRLINALGANGVIWEQTVQTVGEELGFIPGDTVIACAYASYVGIFTRDYREECLDLYMKYLKKNEVPLGPKPDPLGILCSEADQAAWGTQGLPSDRVSLENGAIMTNSQRWSLIIDPQLQGVVWIKNKEAEAGLVITRMGHNKMVSPSSLACGWLSGWLPGWLPGWLSGWLLDWLLRRPPRPAGLS